MGHVFEKLNLKDQPEVVVLQAPLSFEPELAWLADRRVVRDVRDVEEVRFALAFAYMKSELDALSAALVDKAEGDAILWFAYPKRTSKRYRADFDRDHGWEVLRAGGFEPVRQVAIDADWSALRFRRKEHVSGGRRAAG
jgi:hypothetical protein